MSLTKPTLREKIKSWAKLSNLLNLISILCLAAVLKYAVVERVSRYLGRSIVWQEKFVPWNNKFPLLVVCPSDPTLNTTLRKYWELCQTFNCTQFYEEIQDSKERSDLLKGQLLELNVSLELIQRSSLWTINETIEQTEFTEQRVFLPNDNWTGGVYFDVDHPKWCFKLDLSSMDLAKVPLDVLIKLHDMDTVVDANNKCLKWGSFHFLADEDDKNVNCTGDDGSNCLIVHKRHYHKYEMYAEEVNRMSRESSSYGTGICQSDPNYNQTDCLLSYACRQLKENQCRHSLIPCKEIEICEGNGFDSHLTSFFSIYMCPSLIHSVFLNAVTGCPPKCSNILFVTKLKERSGGSESFPKLDQSVVISFNEPEIKVKEEVWNDSFLLVFSDLGGIAGILFGISIYATLKSSFDKIQEGFDILKERVSRNRNSSGRTKSRKVSFFRKLNRSNKTSRVRQFSFDGGPKQLGQHREIN